MIIVKEYTNNNDPLKWNATLYADTRSEVTAANINAVIPNGVTLEPGSNAYTAALEVATPKSDGTWNWK